MLALIDVGESDGEKLSPPVGKPVARGERLGALTGLRFAAAALIVVHHSREIFPFTKGFFWGVPLHHGVSFFFVLSGFILTHVYPRLEGSGALRHFFVARVARIWPAHVFSFLLVLVLGVRSVDAPLGPVIGAANIAMVHAWIPKTAWFFSFNSLSWSISTEFFFYGLFPLLVAGGVRSWWWKMLLALGVVWELVFICNAASVSDFASAGPFAVNRAGLLYIHPLARLAEFILGMGTALLWRGWKIHPRFGAGLANLLEALCVVLCGGAILLLSQKVALRGIFGDAWAAYLSHTGAAPLFAGLILIFAHQRGLLSRMCASAPMVLLGEISFSVYLLHQILLRFMAQNHLLPRGRSEFEPLLYGLFWIVLLISSWLVWRYVERPARRCILQLAPLRIA